ncbi:MAG TPA: ROK family protein [Steroidobacteraceae bacterium]|jgi:polyphosphate glucokinase
MKNPPSPKQILAVDVGGSHVKVLLSGLPAGQDSARRVASNPKLTPAQMVKAVRVLAQGWNFDAVAIGYPGVVWHGRPLIEPHHLGKGWVGFDYAAAFGKPVRMVNDAAMQAIGSYEGGRMLFLGLGTGLGSALVLGGVLEPMELGHLPYRKGRTYEDYLGIPGLARLGKKRWRRAVFDVVDRLSAAFEVDYVVLGGGNVAKLKKLPPRVRAGHNANAFIGGFRLWSEKSWTQDPDPKMLQRKSRKGK